MKELLFTTSLEKGEQISLFVSDPSQYDSANYNQPSPCLFKEVSLQYLILNLYYRCIPFYTAFMMPSFVNLSMAER